MTQKLKTRLFKGVAEVNTIVPLKLCHFAGSLELVEILIMIMIKGRIWISIILCWISFHPFQLVDAIRRGELLNTIRMECRFQGSPVCCEVSNDRVNISYYPNKFPQFPEEHRRCHIRRHYHSAPYETKHLQAIKEISKFTSSKERRRRYVEFMFDDLPSAVKMMQRVEAHMLSFDDPAITPDDHEYLSRFHVKKTCITARNNHEEVQEWVEWIEPLSVYFRHPHAMINCASEFSKEGNKIVYKGKEVTVPWSGPTHVETRDYIILSNQRHARDNYCASKLSSSEVYQRRSYLFDLGSKDFFSSLYWFICGYVQRGIDFDQIYAFEMLKSDVDHYWRTVPNRLIPFIHFINQGVTTSGFGQSFSELPFSIERILQQIVHTDDFVSMKLDIDTSSVEIPILFNLLQTNITTTSKGTIPLAALIDEFFFELHFRCEFLDGCGWRSVPEYVGDMKLDRFHAAQYFWDLRKSGIRAHIWP